MITILVSVLFNVHATEKAPSNIAFQFREGLIWIKARLPQSAEPINLLVDTGAGVSVINLSTAERLGLKLGSAVTVRGVETTFTGHWLRRISAEAGGVQLPCNYLIVDLNKLSSSCERTVDGLLGADFFHERIVQIDFEAQLIRLLPANQAPKCENALPLQLRPCGIRVPITVNDHKSQWMRLDTGCATALQWVNSNVNIRDCKPQVAIGLAELSIPQIQTSVRLGDHKFSDVPTGLHAKSIFAGEAGLLGNGLLSRFSKVTIDAKSGRLFLEALPDAPTP